jgi:hypothetical protein
MNLDNINKPLVISYCNKYLTEKHENTTRFVETLNTNNWEYVVLGDNEVWDGFITKIKGYNNFLKTSNPKKIIVIADAHDMYCLRDSMSFIEMFKKYKSDIVVSMELTGEGSTIYDKNKKYFQVTWLKDYFNYYNINYGHFTKKFVNSGLICGYAKDLLEFTDYLIENNYTDDQKGLGLYMNKYPEKIYADIEGDLLHTCVSMVCGGLQAHSQIYDSPSLNELVGQKSFFLHIPGLKISNGQSFLYNKVYEILKIFNLKELKLIYPNYDLEFFYTYNE